MSGVSGADRLNRVNGIEARSRSAGRAARFPVIGGGLVLLCAAACAQTHAPTDAAIREALTGWMADFNAGRVDRVCELFATDLRYDYRGLGERDYRQMCSGLQRSLGDPLRHYRYALEIKDIIVSGDLAVARVLWTLTTETQAASAPTVTHEHSLDVFRRQADGRWKMTRFVAYDSP